MNSENRLNINNFQIIFLQKMIEISCLFFSYMVKCLGDSCVPLGIVELDLPMNAYVFMEVSHEQKCYSIN